MRLRCTRRPRDRWAAAGEHQALPDTIRFEPSGLLPATVERLQAMGYAIKARTGYSGDVAAIERIASGWVGVADPRRGAGAVGY